MLAISNPPEADCFSFAVACIPAYGASQRQMKIIYFFAISVALAKPRRGGISAMLRRAVNFFNLFAVARYIQNEIYFVLYLVSSYIEKIGFLVDWYGYRCKR
jgi:hypothetical protein